VAEKFFRRQGSSQALAWVGLQPSQTEFANFDISVTKSIKMHYFTQNKKIFWGWGTAPSQEPTPAGDRYTLCRDPRHLRHLNSAPLAQPSRLQFIVSAPRWLKPPPQKKMATSLRKISEIDATRWLLWPLGLDFMKFNFSRGSTPYPAGGRRSLRPSSRMETASPFPSLPSRRLRRLVLNATGTEPIWTPPAVKSWRRVALLWLVYHASRSW